MKYILFLLLFTQLIIQNLSALTLGIVPQQSPFHLIKEWSPIVEYLKKETGEEVILKIERSIPEFEKVLYSGGYDIAYMNPYHYVVCNKKQGYIAALRDDKDIVGILVANKKSGFSDISMIKEKTFLFAAPYAFAATLLIKYELLNNYGIDVDAQNNFLYVNSHDSVYKGVARGIGDVGGGIERTFNNLSDKEAKDSLTILYKTESYPSHPFAYKPSMSKSQEDKFTKAFLNMPTEMLDRLSMHKLIKTDDAEYEIIRDIVKKLSLENK